MVSSRATAPGAEEFMPRTDSGVWLPPQRTFSSLVAGRPFEAERTNHAEVDVERDLASATVSVRAFRQHVNDQLATLFGINMTATPGGVGHYYLTNVGAVDASGVSAGIRAALANRLHGSVEYTLTHARLTAPDSDNLAYLLVFAPSAVRPGAEQIHDVATSIETDVPETATRVVVLYRVSNAFTRSTGASGPVGSVRPSQTSTDPHPALDARFDVQVRQ